jgi:hypothetical protein
MSIDAISRPFRGADYRAGGTMIMLESAYPYNGYGEGEPLYPPQGDDHCIGLIDWACGDFQQCRRSQKNGGAPTVARLCRALTNSENPSEQALRKDWRPFAFTNFVGPSTDETRRPKWEHLEDSKAAFRKFVNKYRPGHLLVASFEVWKYLPDPEEKDIGKRTDTMRAFVLNDGSFCICRRIRHPSRGIGWQTVRRELGRLRAYRVNQGKLKRRGA